MATKINNPYKVLGVSDNADISMCKTAYRRLMRMSHPDFGKGEADIKQREERSKVLNEAMSMIEQGFKIKPKTTTYSFTHKDLFNFSVMS